MRGLRARGCGHGTWPSQCGLGKRALSECSLKLRLEDVLDFPGEGVGVCVGVGGLAVIQVEGTATVKPWMSRRIFLTLPSSPGEYTLSFRIQLCLEPPSSEFL